MFLTALRVTDSGTIHCTHSTDQSVRLVLNFYTVHIQYIGTIFPENWYTIELVSIIPRDALIPFCFSDQIHVLYMRIFLVFLLPIPISDTGKRKNIGAL